LDSILNTRAKRPVLRKEEGRKHILRTADQTGSVYVVCCIRKYICGMLHPEMYARAERPRMIVVPIYVVCCIRKYICARLHSETYARAERPGMIVVPIYVVCCIRRCMPELVKRRG
jgi:hypothetical protein